MRHSPFSAAIVVSRRPYLGVVASARSLGDPPAREWERQLLRRMKEATWHAALSAFAASPGQ
eukprot:4028337-Alexandrium_andersonii.AAC.1